MGEEGVMPLELIRNFAKQKNCLWGVCPARPIPGLRERLRARLARPPFVRADLDERLYPDRHLPGARSMIVLGLPYARQSLGFPADDPSGAITAMAAGEDYHRVLRGILGELAAALRARLDFHAKIFVDSGALLEKEWAVQAGLGFWGKNCAVISPSKGSFFHIGCMLLDAGDCPSDCPDDRPDDRPDVYPDDHPLDRLCGSCRRCVDACPGHAISPEGYGIFFEKCVSYLTQKKGPLTETEIGSMSDHLYGCDVCQQVCPFNAGSCSESFRPESLRVSLDWILQMTPEEFARTLQPTAAGWRGLEILKRNARIALVNGSNGSNGLN